jgi:putative aldouronate transport system substrate-binding protein
MKLMGVSAAAAGVAGVPGVSAQDCEIDWDPTFPEFDKYDPVMEITTRYPTSETYLSGEGPMNNIMYQRIVDNLGISYELTWEGYGGEEGEQKFMTALAAGELPDIFHPTGIGLQELIEEGAVEEIRDIWEETASDLVKDKKGYPDAAMWLSVLRGDEMWAVPFTWGPGWNTDNLGHIRLDWLEELGMNMPTTIDELDTVARAVVDAGLAAYGINCHANFVSWHHSLDPIFGAYGVMPGFWQVSDDGESLYFGSLDPEMKKPIALIRSWYEDGIIDPDFYTHGVRDASEAVTTGSVGLFFSPWWIGSHFIPSIEEANEGAKMGLMPSPIGPDGMVGRKDSGVQSGQPICFRKGVDPEKIRAAIKQLNWQMDMHVNWEKYQQYGEWRNSSGFYEGYEWAWDEDCNMVTGPTWPARTYEYVNTVGFSFPYMCYPEYQGEIFNDLLAWNDMDEAQLNMAQKFLLSQDVVQRESVYYAEVYNTRDNNIIQQFLGSYSSEANEYWADLNEMYNNVVTDIVIGAVEIEAYDQFIEDWKAMGGDFITEEVNSWWESQGRKVY